MTNLPLLLDLLDKSKEAGIKITVTGNELLLKCSKLKNIDEALLMEIRTNKESLIQFLQMQTMILTGNAIKTSPVEIKHNKINYFEITDTQRYWVDPEIDKEYKAYDRVHGTALNVFKITGVFNIEIFSQAVRYLIQRHESLRSTFHFIAGQYVMKIDQGDYESPTAEYLEIRISGSDVPLDQAAFLGFADRPFNFQSGPLFLIRLLQLNDKEIVIAIKVHHVIYDSWSEDILLRDLSVSYRAFIEGVVPDLPILEYQYKDFLALQNQHVKLNKEADKCFWRNKFNALPGEWLLPGTQRNTNSVLTKILRMESFTIPEEFMEHFKHLAKEFSTSLFVLLQSTFALFTYNYINTSDIVIGTDVFGRDYPGSEHQIGCYATTVLVRIALDNKFCLKSAIKNTKQANDDAREHTAFSLLTSLNEILPQDYPYPEFYWNINMHFTDIHESNFYNSKNQKSFPPLGFEFNRIPQETNSIIPNDMQWYYIYFQNKLQLTIRYDGTLYDASSINKIVSEYIDFTSDILHNQNKCALCKNQRII